MADRAGRAGEAFGHLLKGIESSPNDSRIGSLLLDVFCAAGMETDLRDLSRQLPTALVFPNTNGGVGCLAAESTAAGFFASGSAFTRGEQHLKAAVCYRRATQLDPSSADAFNNLGWSLGKLGLDAEAMPALESAVRLRPDYDLARNNLHLVRPRMERRQ